MTQNQAILEHLEQGKPITALEALQLYGCLRLASRISDLKKDGHDIMDQFTEHRGKWFKKYFLDRESK